MENFLKKATDIRLAVFDVDGVLTDGKLILGSNGEEYKTFHVHDGLGLVMLKKNDINVAVISARKSQVVTERMAALGIEHVFQGQDDKRKSLTSLLNDLDVPAEQTLYMGDDLIDLPAMSVAGLSVAVANAHPFVKQHADLVTNCHGGNGAVREVCELLLQAQEKLDAICQSYL